MWRGRLGKFLPNHDGVTITRLSLLLETTRKLDKRYEMSFQKVDKGSTEWWPRENANEAGSAITLVFSKRHFSVFNSGRAAQTEHSSLMELGKRGRESRHTAAAEIPAMQHQQEGSYERKEMQKTA